MAEGSYNEETIKTRFEGAKEGDNEGLVSELDKTDETMEALFKVASMLAQKLDPVLRAGQEAKVSGSTNGDPVKDLDLNSQVVTRMNRQRIQLRKLISDLGDLHYRVQI